MSETRTAEFLTVSEAAALCRLGRSTVYMLIRKGEFPAVRFGSAVRVPAETLAEWLRQQTRMPERAA